MAPLMKAQAPMEQAHMQLGEQLRAKQGTGSIVWHWVSSSYFSTFCTK